MTTAAEEDRLEALEVLGAFDTPAEERFDRVTRLCQRLFGVPMAFVNLVGRDDVWSKSAQGLALTQTPRDQMFCSTTIQEPGGMVVEDASNDPRFAGMDAVLDDPGIRFYAGVPLAAPGGQRVGTLCIADTEPRGMTDADRAVLQDLALWVQKEFNLDEELDRAAAVQRALFPATVPADARWDVAGACRPSNEVGGDFYDWYPVPGATAISLGDVMGKGMPAAIVMASVRSTLRVGAQGADVGDALGLASRALAPDLQAVQSFVTVLLARLQPDGSVSCADAGHGHVAIVRKNGRIEVTEDGGMPLGVDPEERYDTYERLLGAGDMLLVHSDGLIELEGGPRSTLEAAQLVAEAATAQDAVDSLLRLVGESAPPDDVTAVVARLR